MKIFKTLLMAAVAVVGLSSCMKTGTYHSTASYKLDDSNNISYITNLETNESYTLAGANFEWYYVSDNDGSRVQIKIANLQVTPTGSRMSFETEEIPYTISEGATTASVDLLAAGGHTLSDFHYRQFSRILYDENKTLAYCQTTYYEISFVVDDIYAVKVLPTTNIVGGYTEVINTLDNNKTVGSYNPFFSYELNLDKKTAIFTIRRLTIDGQTFSEVSFMNVPFKVNSGYEFVIESEGSITPVGIDGRALELLKTPKFSVKSSFLPDMNGTFTTERGYEVKFHGSAYDLNPKNKEN